MPQQPPSNEEIAAVLDRIADLLAAKDENPFRVRSYRTAAASVSSVRQSLATLVLAKGTEGLAGLKGVGEKLSGLIEEYVKKGTVELLTDLEKDLRQDKLKAIQEKKAEHTFSKPIQLPVATILEIDAEYRKQASAGKLKMIAPRLLNPKKKAWLPLMARVYKGYKFTVMFSNTATAHKLEETDDWVVVYFENGKGENQCTVVTESRSALEGKRVIRGREREYVEFYSR